MHWKLKYVFTVYLFQWKEKSFCISWTTLIFISTLTHKQWVFSSLLFNYFRVRVSLFNGIFSVVPTSVKFSNYIFCGSICGVIYSSFWSQTSKLKKKSIFIITYSICCCCTFKLLHFDFNLTMWDAKHFL